MKVPTVIAVLACFLLTSHKRTPTKTMNPQFINKKKDQAIVWYVAPRARGIYCVYSKNNDKQKEFWVPGHLSGAFEDSLKRAGWTTEIQMEPIEEYKASTELISVTPNYGAEGDTTYEVIYNVKLAYPKYENSRVKQDTLRTLGKFSKEDVIEAFMTNKFLQVSKVGGTNLIKTLLHSEVMDHCFETNTLGDTLGISHVRVFYF